MLACGIVATFSLPAIGYFDEHTYMTMHGACAILFFASVGIYSFMVADVMNKNLD